MNIKWEEVKSEDQLKADTLKGISVEKEGSAIVAMYLEFEDGRHIKICKTSDYSKFLSVFTKEPTTKLKEVTYVMGRSGNTVTETLVENENELGYVKADMEASGYETWVRKEQKEVSVDIISNKEIDDIPF